jgi:D-psicose/D-tagatose/L-ribulose 3-epimerase
MGITKKRRMQAASKVQSNARPDELCQTRSCERSLGGNRANDELLACTASGRLHFQTIDKDDLDIVSEAEDSMKFGVNTFLWGMEFGTAELPLLPKLRDAGFDGVELPVFEPATFPAGAVRRAAEENGLGLTYCCVMPHGLHAGHESAAVRDETLSYLKAVVKSAAESGATLVCGPLYSPVGYLPGRRRTSDEWRWAVDTYHRLGDTLTNNRVDVAVEPLNRFETYFLNTTADGVKFCQEVGHGKVGLLFDTFHTNIEEKDTLAALRQTGEFLKHFHASENDRGTPGTGHVAWAPLLGELKARGYDGWVTIESFGFSVGKIAAAASIWRDLAPTVDEIAIGGVKFLKKSFGV